MKIHWYHVNAYFAKLYSITPFYTHTRTHDAGRCACTHTQKKAWKHIHQTVNDGYFGILKLYEIIGYLYFLLFAYPYFLSFQQWQCKEKKNLLFCFGLAIFFYKRPESKCFKLRGPGCLCCNYSNLPLCESNQANI